MNLPAARPTAEIIEIKLPRNARQFLASLTARHETPFEQLPEGNRRRAKLREILVLRVHSIADTESLHVTPAVLRLMEQCAARMESPTVLSAAAELARQGDVCPSKASLLRWVGDHDKHGLAGLADGHTGRKRVWYGWEPAMLSMWLTAGQQDCGSIAFRLRHMGYESATDSRVRSFRKSFPESLGRYAPERVGKHFYQQNCTPHRLLDWSNVPVGYMYEADGHTVDWYTRHPLTGNPARLELVVWLDRRSHYAVGWILWDRESALSTLFSLSRAMILHDHVPAAVHVDQGSGFKNRAFTDETMGFFRKFAIKPSLAHPGNARGKGLVEGFFKHLEARLGKSYSTYCGHDRTDDGLRRMAARIKRGDLELPDYQQVLADLSAYMNAYNSEPQKGLGGRAPRDLWESELLRNPVNMPADAVVRLSEQRTVSQKGRIALRNRTFQDGELADHRSRRVIVEFDPFDWSQVWIYDLKRRFICIAKQVDADPALPGSHLEDKNRQRAVDAVRRLEAHAAEKEARAGLAKTHVHVLDDIAALEKKTGSTSANVPPVESRSEIELDILNTDY